MARRLIIAFVLSVVLTVLCVVWLTPFGLAQVALVPMMAFVVMAIASIVVEADRAREKAEEEEARAQGDGDEATCGCGGECNCGDGCGCVDSCRCVKQSATRSVGCCGPRPIGEASRLRNENAAEGDQGGCGCGSGGCGS